MENVKNPLAIGKTAGEGLLCKKLRNNLSEGNDTLSDKKAGNGGGPLQSEQGYAIMSQV